MNKQTLFSLIVVVVTVAFSLLAAEMVLRLKNANGTNYDIEMWRYAKELKVRSSNPVLGHEHVPSSSAILQRVLIRTDSHGLRGVEPPPPSDKRRILMLGSSITLGWGVAEEEVASSLLQAHFSADGKDVEVLNAGIGNYNAERYVERFITKLTDLKPTDIVVHYFLRDAETLDAGGGSWLIEHSQLAVTLWVSYNRIFGKSGENSLQNWYRLVYEPTAPGYKAMQTALHRLADYARANDIRVYLAMQPDVHNLVNYPFASIHQRIRELSANLGFTYVDLLPAFSGLKPETIWALPGDPHPNALGHKIIADTIYPIIAKPAP